MSKPYSSYNPQLPDRCFRIGALVRWNPPVGAYSPRSGQALHAGLSGLVVSLYADDAAFVNFGNCQILCNTAYLEQING